MDDVKQALRRYCDARADFTVSDETAIMYADELAEAVMKAGRRVSD